MWYLQIQLLGIAKVAPKQQLHHEAKQMELSLEKKKVIMVYEFGSLFYLTSKFLFSLIGKVFIIATQVRSMLKLSFCFREKSKYFIQHTVHSWLPGLCQTNFLFSTCWSGRGLYYLSVKTHRLLNYDVGSRKLFPLWF